MTPTVLINSGPWLTVPPFGYGGIENIIATLIPQLRRRGVRVILATIGQSTIDVDEKICVFDDPQFSHLTEPYNDVVGVAAAHLQRIARRTARPFRYRPGPRPYGGLGPERARRHGHRSAGGH